MTAARLAGRVSRDSTVLGTAGSPAQGARSRGSGRLRWRRCRPATPTRTATRTATCLCRRTGLLAGAGARAGTAQAEVRAQIAGKPGDHRAAAGRISGRPPAGGAANVLRQDLGGLVTEPAEQVTRPGGNPQRETVLVMPARLEARQQDRQQMADHSLAAGSDDRFTGLPIARIHQASASRTRRQRNPSLAPDDPRPARIVKSPPRILASTHAKRLTR